MECKQLCYIAVVVSLLALVAAGNPHVEQVKTGYDYNEFTFDHTRYIPKNERKRTFCNKNLEEWMNAYVSKDGSTKCIKKTPDKKPVLVVYGLHIPPWR